MLREFMDTPKYFELADGYARYCPVAEVTLQEGINLLTIAIGYAREQKIRHILIDTTKLSGFEPPTTLDRFTLGGQAARAGRSTVKVAMVAKPEMIDPKKFGVTVAKNRGLNADVFTTEAEALAWLLATDGA
jgi:hypothetical protein